MASPTHRLAHLPTLDGLRAVAVIAVLGYHAGLSRAGGGFLGVEVFFVVSGFVITALLHAEVAASGAVDLRRFWVRRIRRLVPALAVLLVAVAGLGLWGWPDEVARWRGEWFASGAWVSNWYLIAAERSYFDTVGRASPLRHLWSLAVEAQFYLLWPPVFAVLARRLRSRRDPARDLALVIGAAAMVAFALGQLLYRPGSDPSRVYYGTDTRAVGLLIGATLAMLRPPGLEPGTGGTAVAATPSSRTLTIAADGVSALGLAALVSAFVAVDEFSDTTYRGGITAVAMLTATLIALSLHPEVRLARAVLGHPWAQAVGRRSYSLYLWHWPVFVVTRPDHDLPLGTTAALVPRLVLTVVLAELSYRWVEQPVRDGRARHHVLEWWRKATSAPGPVRVAAALSGALAVTAAATTATLVVAGVLDASSRGPGFDTTERTIEIGAAGPVAPGGRAVPAPGAATVTPDTTGGAVAGVPAPPAGDPLGASITTAAASATAPSPAPAPPPTPTPSPPATPSPTSTPATGPAPSQSEARAPGVVIAIGDSVLLSGAKALDARFPGIGVDAAVARQPIDGVELIKRWRAAGGGGDTVIVHLGNNGQFHGHQVEETMVALAAIPRVVFVNVRVPQRWEEQVNGALAEVVPRYANAELVDWKQAATSCPADSFAPDGVHLEPPGAQCYAEVIYRAAVGPPHPMPS